MSELSLADVASVVGNNNENGWGGNGAWAMIILFALIFGNGGFGNNAHSNLATTADVQRATDFQALERQNNEGVAASRQVGYDVTTAVKDGNYNLLGEVRTFENNVNAGLANLQNAHTEILRSIDNAKYENALSTASINENTTAQVQKILDTMSANKIADMQAQISQLQLQNAMSGVVRYPNGWAYNAGTSPFCNCSCGSMS